MSQDQTKNQEQETQSQEPTQTDPAPETQSQPQEQDQAPKPAETVKKKATIKKATKKADTSAEKPKKNAPKNNKSSKKTTIDEETGDLKNEKVPQPAPEAPKVELVGEPNKRMGTDEAVAHIMTQENPRSAMRRLANAGLINPGEVAKVLDEKGF